MMATHVGVAVEVDSESSDLMAARLGPTSFLFLFFSFFLAALTFYRDLLKGLWARFPDIFVNE